MYYNNVTYICNVIIKQVTMKTLKLESATFNKRVIATIKSELPKVKSFKKYNNKLVALKDENNTTIATWNKELFGSNITLNSWY